MGSILNGVDRPMTKLEQCDCEGICMWSCSKLFTCRSRTMRNFSELLDDDDLEELTCDEEEED